MKLRSVSTGEPGENVPSQSRGSKREHSGRVINPLGNVSINVAQEACQNEPTNEDPKASMLLNFDEAIKHEFEQRVGGPLNDGCIEVINKIIAHVDKCCNLLPNIAVSDICTRDMTVPRRMEQLQKELKLKFHPRNELIKVGRPKVGKFAVGDLVWAKVERWAYWPGMVVIEPFKPNFAYTKMNEAQEVTSYFVQFFGNKQYKGWVPASNVHTYGEWNELKNSVIREEIRYSEKRNSYVGTLKGMYYTKGWIQAIAEANAVQNWSAKERLRKVTYEYVKFGQF